MLKIKNKVEIKTPNGPIWILKKLTDIGYSISIESELHCLGQKEFGKNEQKADALFDEIVQGIQKSKLLYAKCSPTLN